MYLHTCSGECKTGGPGTVCVWFGGNWGTPVTRPEGPVMRWGAPELNYNTT